MLSSRKTIQISAQEIVKQTGKRHFSADFATNCPDFTKKLCHRGGGAFRPPPGALSATGCSRPISPSRSPSRGCFSALRRRCRSRRGGQRRRRWSGAHPTSGRAGRSRSQRFWPACGSCGRARPRCVHVQRQADDDELGFDLFCHLADPGGNLSRA